MRRIKDLSPKGRSGDVAQLTIAPEDMIIARSVFNLDYLESIIKRLKKDIGKTEDKKLVEIQLVRPRYAVFGRYGDNSAIVFRAKTCDPNYISGNEQYCEYGSIHPDTGYYGIAPIVQCWDTDYDLSDLPGLYPITECIRECNREMMKV